MICMDIQAIHKILVQAKILHLSNPAIILTAWLKGFLRYARDQTSNDVHQSSHYQIIARPSCLGAVTRTFNFFAA